MSQRSKRRAPRGKSAPTELSPAAIERKAQEDLAGGRHREAIAGFKQLLKQEPHPAWHLALADAYAGRARELAAKDMLKEALAIWENRVGLGEDITFDPEHVALLLRMGRVESVLDLSASGNAIPPPQQDRVRFPSSPPRISPVWIWSSSGCRQTIRWCSMRHRRARP